VFRVAVNIGFLDRPLAGGLLWAALSSGWSPGLQIAVFFELFWLDLIPVGTFIPPHALFSTILTASVSQALGLHQVSDVCLVMLLAMPFGTLFGRFEAVQRNRQNQAHTDLLHWARRRSAGPDILFGLVRKSLAQIMGLVFVGFMLSAGIVFSLAEVLLQHRFIPPSLTWAHLWIFASIGGVLSLRVARIYSVFGAALVFVLLVLVFR
jgi:PTS system mannose-specific IIC component